MPKYQYQLDQHYDTVVSEIQSGNSLGFLCEKHSLNYHAFYKKIKSEFPDLLSHSKSKVVRQRMADSHKPLLDEETLKIMLYEKNMTYQEIANEIGSVKATICGLVKRYGLTPKRMSDYTNRLWTPEKRKTQQEKCFNGEIGVHRVTEGKYRFTKPERLFAAWCDKNEIEYSRQFQIKPFTHRFDFVIINRRLLVEIDGEYWHENEQQKTKDNAFDSFAVSEGYTVIRFSDKEIHQTKMNCFNKLYDALN
jgi:hypothetical protein